jgi:uncharacterized protein (TIGR00299 family) protein
LRIAYFDTIAGISGDMTLGAFISAGVSPDLLRAELGKLPLPGVELEVSHRTRNGIHAVKVDVVISAPQTHRRHLRDILSLIDGSGLSAAVKARSRAMFQEVAGAEAKVHNSTIEAIHFHEVGALDSIADIVGAAVCLEACGVEAVYSSPVRLGSGGFVDTEHGRLPVPSPATVEILKTYPVVLTDIPYELTTPTGAAIIKATSSGTLALERLKVEAVGYGAGSRELPGVPNVLRVLIGELGAGEAYDELVSVETNIDNMNPEIFPYLIERLLASGANDAYLIPVLMKKGRPGTVVSVLAARSVLDRVTEVLFRETTTLGLRIQPVERRKVERGERSFQSSFGVVAVKTITYDGVTRLAPEFEECRRIAEAHRLPLVEVYRRLERELGAGGTAL